MQISLERWTECSLDSEKREAKVSMRAIVQKKQVLVNRSERWRLGISSKAEIPAGEQHLEAPQDNKPACGWMGTKEMKWQISQYTTRLTAGCRMLAGGHTCHNHVGGIIVQVKIGPASKGGGEC